METQQEPPSDGGVVPVLGAAAPECAFPPCHRSAKTKPPGSSGAPLKYCDDPGHTPLNATRWRKKHGESPSEPVVSAVPDDLSSLSHTSAVAEAQTHELSLKALLAAVLDRLPAHQRAMEAAGDPELVSLQIANAEKQAQLAVTKAQADLSAEREARVTAEGASERFKDLWTEATEAVLEADGLRATAVKLAEEASEQAAAGVVLAVLAVRAQQAAEQRAREETAASRKAAGEAVHAAEEDAKNRIQAAVDEASELVRQAAAREKKATEAAAAKVEEIERQTAEHIEKTQREAAQQVADATRKVELAEGDVERVTTRAEQQAKEAIVERRRLVDDHLTDRQRLIREHGEERDRLVGELEQTRERMDAERDRLAGELEQTRERMGEDLEQARKYGTDQTAALTRTEKARAIAQKNLEQRERDLTQLRAQLEEAERKDTDDNPGATATPSGGVPEGHLPGQGEFFDEQARPVGDVSQPGDTAGQDRSAGED